MFRSIRSCFNGSYRVWRGRMVPKSRCGKPARIRFVGSLTSLRPWSNRLMSWCARGNSPAILPPSGLVQCPLRGPK